MAGVAVLTSLLGRILTLAAVLALVGIWLWERRS
jgi:hypothetical protein